VRRFFWGAFLLLDGLLLFLFATGYAARALPPGFFWWTEVIAVGLPYLTFALLVATVPMLMRRRWVLAGLHGVVLGLAALRFFPFGLQVHDPSPDDLTLMTYNVSPWVGEPGEVKTRAMLRLVQAEQPALLCFQETGLTFFENRRPRQRVDNFIDALTDSLGYRVRALEGGKPSYTPQPVLGRAELISKTQTLLRRDGRLTYVTRMQVRWQGRDVALYNLHLRSYGEDKPWEEEDAPPFAPGLWIAYLGRFYEAYRARAWEASQIRDMLVRETLPLIVCGDFNSTPHNWVYGHLAEGLQDAFRQAGSGWGGTYHTRFPFARIDFVLVSPEWEIVSAHVPGVVLSDHRPLVVRLRWRE
jgi:endonuclease/exonuclease/phosphatase family metal-dependent hydrolase